MPESQEMVEPQRTFCLYLFLILVALSGCAQTAPSQGPHARPHPHINPLTQVVGDYHIRLVVEQSEGRMYLVFEDISEEPIRAVRPKLIRARVYLPDGEEIKITFHPVPPWYQKYSRHRRHHRKRPVSLFIYKSNWVRAVRRFDMVVDFSFGHRVYPLEFKYSSHGGFSGAVM